MGRLVIVGLIVLFLPISLISCKPAGEKVKLRYSFNKGDRYNIYSTADNKVYHYERYFSDPVSVDKSLGTWGFTLTIEDIIGDAAIVRRTPNSIYLKEESQAGYFEYDSSTEKFKFNIDLPTSTIMVAFFNAMIGESTLYRMFPTSYFEVVPESIDVLERNVTEKISSSLRDKWGYFMLYKEKYNKDTFLKEANDTMKKIVIKYPDKPVRIGDSWRTADSYSDENYPLSVENIYTLKECDEKECFIRVKGKCKGAAETLAPDFTGGLEKVKTAFSGNDEGIIKIDKSTGMILSANINRKLSGSVRMGWSSRPFSSEYVATLKMEKVE